MNPSLAESKLTWAEERALQRCNPSAVPEVGVTTGPAWFRPGCFQASHQHEREKWTYPRLVGALKRV